MIKLAKIWLSIWVKNQLFREKMIPKINGWRPASCSRSHSSPILSDFLFYITISSSWLFRFVL